MADLSAWLEDPLAHRALDALVRAESRVTRRLAAELERRGVSATGFSMLVVLASAGGRRAADPAASARGQQGERDRGLDDARAARPRSRASEACATAARSMVRITPAGRAAGRGALPRPRPAGQGRVHPLDDEEKRELTKLCRKLDRRRLARQRSHLESAAWPLPHRSTQPALPRARGARARALARERRLPRDPAPARGRPALRLLRGPADRERRARAPTTCCRASSRTSSPATRRCAATTCRARRAGTATGCRSSSRSSASSASARRRRSSATASPSSTAVPRVGLLLRRGVEPADRADRLLDRPRRRLRHARERVHRVGLVEPEADLGRGPALPGPQGRALLPALRHALSSHEVALGYRDVVDPSVYVRFPVTRAAGPLEDGDVLLVWTTTPWTLVSNAAVAVDPGPDLRARAARRRASTCSPRACVERGARRGGASPRPLPGREIEGTRYEPPFGSSRREAYGERGHTVLPADFVTAEDGTGLVHTAIAFGEDDFRLGEQYGLAVVNPVRPDGTYDERIGPYAGPLRQGRRPRPDRRTSSARGRLLRAEEYEHTYPLCWRCDTPLLYYAKSSWYIRTTATTRRAAGGQRADRVVPVPHQARALRQLAREQRRLGAVARALLGHAAADLDAASRATRHCIGSIEELRRAGRRRRGARGPAPPVHRRAEAALHGVRRRDDARAGGDRRLVRLGLDAVRAVALPVRERGAVRAALPGGLHLRGARPDARLVLLAARDLDAAVRRAPPTRTCSASA